MIYFYWPNKSIPSWLQDIKFVGTPDPELPAPFAKHAGFGVVVNVKQHYIVWIASGIFMHVWKGGTIVYIRGGGKRVYANGSLRRCISEAFWTFKNEA